MKNCLNKLFPVIRAAFDISSLDVSITAEECEELAAFGQKQSILPLIYAGLKKMELPAGQLEAIDRVRNRDLLRFVLQNDALQKIETALKEAGIPCLPLKGAVLRNFYPAPEMRTSCDIDVLVHEEDLNRAVEAIETNTDFKKRRRYYHDVSMINSGVHLELHFNIRENMENIDKLLVRVWDYAVPDEGSRYKLTPEFQIFHVVAHMSYHMVHGGLGIRPLLDLWLLRTKTLYDEETVRQMCSGCGILTFYDKCCELVDAWMTGEPVPEDLSTLEEYTLNGGVYGSKDTATASKQREHRGFFSYFVHRVFMSREVLSMEYPELKEKPYLLPLFQVRRWSRLINPQKRKQVKKEIISVRAIKPETIDSFDKLLLSLGL